MSAVARIESPASAPATVTPMEMIDRALQKGADVGTLEKLMDLQDRYEKAQGRKEFEAAITAAKAEIKPVTKNRQGHNSKRYADFAAVAAAVDPILSKHGLSYRFKTEQGDKIAVTCVLTHRSGHSETTTLTAPADATGNKNAVQAIGSTLTYLQRYSLVQMLGLAASDDDDAQAHGEPIDEKQIEQLQKLIVETGSDIPKFCKYMKVEKIEDIPAGKFPAAAAALEAKRK